jgi:hypothetical protein
VSRFLRSTTDAEGSADNSLDVYAVVPTLSPLQLCPEHVCYIYYNRYKGSFQWSDKREYMHETGRNLL